MPYNVNGNYTISDPVSIADVQSAVPVTIKRTVSGVEERRSSADVGVLCGGIVGDSVPDNAGGTAWTVSARVPINIWSARKPVYSTKIGTLTTDEWNAYAHEEDNYKNGGGIKKPVVSGQAYISGIGDYGNPADAVWVYDRPIKDGLCVFRLTDFWGYYHKAVPTFEVLPILSNLTSIPVPSSGSTTDLGQELEFGIKFKFIDKCISPKQLFLDCQSPAFYPGVIISCGSYKLTYVKTSNQPIDSYLNTNYETVVYVKVHTRTFMDKMTAYWSERYAGDPYQSFPFRTGDKWTITYVLLDTPFDGGTNEYGGLYTLGSGNSIVRLEYAKPAGDEHADRRIMPLKQSKFTSIEWMKLRVQVSYDGVNRVWKLSVLRVTAKMLTTSAETFTIDARLSTTTNGVVNVENHGSGRVVSVNGYGGPVTLQGSVGQEVSYAITNYPATTYDLTNVTGTGNKICAGDITFTHATIGSFVGSFSINTENTGDLIKDIQLF